MIQLGVAVFDLMVDLQTYKAQLEQAEKHTQSSVQQMDSTTATGTKNQGQNWMAAAGKLGLWTAAISLADSAMRNSIQTTRESIAIASDHAESWNFVRQEFGAASDEIEEWAQTSTASIVQTEVDTARAAALFKNMAENQGLSADAAIDMSKGLTEMAADWSSFYNLNPQEATEKLTGALSGEMEGVKRLGIALDERTLKEAAVKHGITETVRELTRAEKVQTIYLELMRQSADATGDVARTQFGLANTLREMTANIEEFKAKWGAAFAENEDVIALLQRASDIIKELGSEEDIARIERLVSDLAVVADGLLEIMQALDTSGMGKLLDFVNMVQNPLAGLADIIRGLRSLMSLFVGDWVGFAEQINDTNIMNLFGAELPTGLEESEKAMEELRKKEEETAAAAKVLSEETAVAGEAVTGLAEAAAEAELSLDAVREQILKLAEEDYDAYLAKTEELRAEEKKKFEERMEIHHKFFEEKHDMEQQALELVLDAFKQEDEAGKDALRKKFANLDEWVAKDQEATDNIIDDTQRRIEAAQKEVDEQEQRIKAYIDAGAAERKFYEETIPGIKAHAEAWKENAKTIADHMHDDFIASLLQGRDATFMLVNAARDMQGELDAAGDIGEEAFERIGDAAERSASRVGDAASEMLGSMMGTAQMSPDQMRDMANELVFKFGDTFAQTRGLPWGGGLTGGNAAAMIDFAQQLKENADRLEQKQNELLDFIGGKFGGPPSNAPGSSELNPLIVKPVGPDDTALVAASMGL